MINFVHIPKTGGVAFQALIKECGLFNHCIHEKAPSPSITIVRHPYDRLISAYCYLIQHGDRHEVNIVPQQRLQAYGDFKNFVFHIREDNLLNEIVHLRPMVSFLPVDRIFKIENTREIDAYLAAFGLMPLSGFVSNTSDHGHYTDFLDSEIIAEINGLYKEDFERFDYKMLSAEL